jgi:hypothetical protein
VLEPGQCEPTKNGGGLLGGDGRVARPLRGGGEIDSRGRCEKAVPGTLRGHGPRARGARREKRRQGRCARQAPRAPARCAGKALEHGVRVARSGARHAARARHQRLRGRWEERGWVECDAALSQLEVEMRAETRARAAGDAEALARRHLLADGHRRLVEMRVQRLEAVAEIDEDDPSVAFVVEGVRLPV